MCLKFKIYNMLAALLVTGSMAFSQTAVLELTSGTANGLPPVPGSGFGPRVTDHVVTFENDAANISNFSLYSPALTVTVGIKNQQYTGRNYGSGGPYATTTGMVFGAQPTTVNSATPGNVQSVLPINSYDFVGTFNGSGGPRNGMFMSNPTATPVVTYFPLQSGTGIDGTGATFGNDINSGVQVFTTSQVLFDALAPNGLPNNTATRYYMGDVVVTFNRPVKDPVIHLAGLGASYRYFNGGNADTTNWRSTFMSTELQLVENNTLTKMAGNQFFVVSGKDILNNAVKPNGESFYVPGTLNNFSDFGAATGSVRVSGTVSVLTFKVFLRGSDASQFNWSAPMAVIPGSQHDPLTGDIWNISASLSKPNQQISGNVYIDKDVTDNNIHTSFGLPNDRTNAGGTLFANLIRGGVVVATVPISVTGDYLFDNVAINTGYTVQVGTTSGSVGNPPPLPANWSRTGEFIGPGAGTDGNVNGTSSSFDIVADQIVANVDFGIRAGICPGNILYTDPGALTGYFGGFEVTPTANNFFPTGVNLSSGPGRLYAQTPLAAANYSVTNDPNSFDNLLSSFKALGGANQLVVKPTINQVVYYLVDSAGKYPVGHPLAGQQTYFRDGNRNSFFRGWFANTSATNAVVKIKIYDAEIPATVYKDVDITVTGSGSNSWIYWNQAWEIPTGAPLPKKLRFDIISVNGAPFTIDDLCFVEPQLSPLQITLSDFTVTKSSCTANLVWKTSSESNSDRFEVEVATNGSAVYSKTGTVAASGSSSIEKSYQYSYAMQPGTIYYFRLKMIDKDGSFKYSDTRSASCNYKGGIVIAPNPVIKSFTIKGMEAGRNVITIFADNGQLVKTQVSVQVQEVIDISNLAPGLYAVKVMSEKGNMVVEKIIKK